MARIRYRASRVRTNRQRNGRKRLDDVTGFWSYEDYLDEDCYGNLTDVRYPNNFDNPDTRFEQGQESDR